MEICIENAKAASLKKNKHQKELIAYLMILPQIIGFLVFTIYPILWVFRYAFYNYDGFNAVFIGLENFKRAFTQDADFWWSIINTIIIAYGKLIVEIPLSLIVALLLTSKIIKGKKLFSVGFYLPNVTGAAVNCLIFSFLFSTMNGPINNALVDFGIISTPHNWFGDRTSAMAVVMLLELWTGFAANVLFFMAGIANLSEEVLEAAQIDGANKFQSFIRVTVPMLAPVLKVILMLAMVNGMKIMNSVLLLTNGGPAGGTNVVMLHIYKLFFTQSITPQYGYASCLGLITTVVIGIMTIGYLAMSKKADMVY